MNLTPTMIKRPTLVYLMGADARQCANDELDEAALQAADLAYNVNKGERLHAENDRRALLAQIEAQHG